MPEVELLIRDCLAGTSLWNVNYLQCEMVSHFAQRRASNAKVSASPTPIDVTNELIGSINAYNDAQVAEYRAHNPLGDRAIDPYEPDRPDGADALIAAGMLAPVPLWTKGVRFYITFDHPRRALSPAQVADVEKRIEAKCEEVRRRWARRDPNGVEPQISFYSGTGTMTDFLVLSRAPYGHFHAFVRDFVLGLWSIGLGDLHQMRPYSQVLADEMFSDFHEHRPTVESTNIDSEVLLGGESETREFKASFALDVRRVWRDGVYDKSPIMTDNVIKAVCGLLNSRDGGVVAIGVLEVERETQKVKDAAKLLEWAKAEFAYDAVRDEKGQLPNLVLGVQLEYGPGRIYSDLDKYLSAIRDSLKAKIEPSPWSWLRMVARSISGRDVVVISVRPAETWCYATVAKSDQPQFFVREAASTRAYHGLEADLYKHANPRPTRSAAN